MLAQLQHVNYFLINNHLQPLRKNVSNLLPTARIIKRLLKGFRSHNTKRYVHYSKIQEDVNVAHVRHSTVTTSCMLLLCGKREKAYLVKKV